MTNATQYIELGLRLACFLNTGKQPNKYSDQLWEIAIKLLDTPIEIVKLPSKGTDNG